MRDQGSSTHYLEDDVYELDNPQARLPRSTPGWQPPANTGPSGTAPLHVTLPSNATHEPAQGPGQVAVPSVALDPEPIHAQAPAPPPRRGLLASLWKPSHPASPPSDLKGTHPTAAPHRARGEINLRGRRMPRRQWTDEAPAWALSAIVHGTVFGVLAVAGLTPQIQNEIVRTIGAAPFDPKLTDRHAEDMAILDPISAEPSEMATTPLDMEVVTSSGSGFTGIGSAVAPSPTPAMRGRRSGSPGGISTDKLPDVKTPGVSSPVAGFVPGAPTVDLQGRSGVAGDPARPIESIGEALDQLAAEIIRQIAGKKLTVIWMFDESGSMRDDQKAVRDKFDHVASELKGQLDAEQKEAGVLTHLIVGFGQDLHFDLPKPTADIDLIGKAIDRLRVDESGFEHTLQAIRQTIDKFASLITKERRLMIVLVTDESGDDGAQIEEARVSALRHDVPIYVIGRQSLFGYDRAHLLYEDPVTKDHYWPAIKRGPETAAIECLQWDGLHERWDEQPAGFPPYELARMVKDTGGIYFLLPNEENLRVRRREQRYSSDILREYMPEYGSRTDYVAKRAALPLRQSLYEIIEGTKNFGFRRHFPVELSALGEAIRNEFPIVEERLRALVAVENRLRSLQKARDRETEKRWQAQYDLMLAQIVCAQIKAFEYMACLQEMVALGERGQLKTSEMPDPNRLGIDWVLDHSKERKAPTDKTDKKYAQAERLFKDVIAKHPKTPWADLAQDCIDRGFGVQRNEWKYSPQYQERAKYVPKY